MRVAQLDKERKKINIPVKIENTQYAEENLDEWWVNKVSLFHHATYTKLFTTQTFTELRASIDSRLHCVFLKGYN